MTAELRGQGVNVGGRRPLFMALLKEEGRQNGVLMSWVESLKKGVCEGECSRILHSLVYLIVIVKNLADWVQGRMRIQDNWKSYTAVVAMCFHAGRVFPLPLLTSVTHVRAEQLWKSYWRHRFLSRVSRVLAH